MPQDLLKAASDQSLGLSHGAIYDCTVKLIHQLKLSGSVLDFGAGVGAFTKMLGATGQFNMVTGINLMPRPENLEPHFLWKQHNLNEPILEWNNKFNLIVATEVIEHLENPRAMMRNCNLMLKPGGHIILSMPNNESWRAILSLIFRGHFIDFLDNSYPAHINALLLKDIQRIFSECSIEEIKTQYSNYGKIPKLTHMTWQNISKNLFKGKRYSDNMIVVGIKH